MNKTKMTPQELFALESNQIEGERTFTEGQEFSVLTVEDWSNNGKPLTLDMILKLHSMCFKEDWAGKWRTCQVYIGKHLPPPAIQVPNAMEEWIKKLDDMDSWEAHNSFVEIHGFVDGNGRISRLIWLYKALQEGYYYSDMSFLHKFYYQTLQKYDDKRIK